jgi:hypothetical protein
MRTHYDITERVRAEYLEMPGLQLTLEQTRRLCGIEHTVCKIVLDALVDEQFLRVKSDGTYARVTDGRLRRLSPAEVGPVPGPRFQKAS